jgi:DNA-binding beta-propeller fold protein YncE
MFFATRVMKKKITKIARAWRQPLILVLLAILFSSAPPAFATRHDAQMVSLMKSLCPGAQLRLDGAVNTGGGNLYLPLFSPAKLAAKKAGTAQAKVQLKGRFPQVQSQPSPGEALLYLLDDGTAFLRVVKTKNGLSFPALESFPQSVRNELLCCRLPEDLIVPEHFALAGVWQPVVGELVIALQPEALNKTGNSTGKAAGGTKVGAVAQSAVFFLSSSSTGAVNLLDALTFKKLAEFSIAGTPSGLCLIKNKLYLADQTKNRLLVFEPSTAALVREINLPPKSAPKAIVPVGDNLLYVSENGAGALGVLELSTGKLLLQTKLPPGPSRMAITPNGNTALVLTPSTGQLSFVSTLNHRLLGSITVGANPAFVTISHDGRYAYVSCKSADHVAVVDITRRQVLGVIKTGAGPSGLVLSPDGTKLYVALAKDNQILVYDLAGRAELTRVKLPIDVDFPGGICLNTDGTKLLVTSAATANAGILDLVKGEFIAWPELGRSSDEAILVLLP